MQSPSRTMYDNRDLYAPTQVEDLLSGVNDWRNIQDIVRLTFKALSDIVRTQGSAILDLERQLNNRLTRQEINNLIQSKADSYFVNENFTELRAKIEEKANKAEVNYQMSHRPSVEDVRMMLESRVTSVQLEAEVKDIHRAIDRTQQYNTELQEKLDKLSEFHGNEIRNRVRYQELNEFKDTLEQKYDPVWNEAVLKQDFDYWVENKANVEDLQRMQGILETKAEYGDLENLQFAIDDKVDTKQFLLLEQTVNQKLEQNEFKKYYNQFDMQIGEISKRIQSDSEQGASSQNRIREDLDRLKEILQSQIIKKADQVDLDQAFKSLKQKADQEKVNYQLEQLKQEFNQYMADIQRQQNQQKEDFNNVLDDTANSLNYKAYELQCSIDELQNQQAQSQEERKIELDHMTSYTQTLNSSTMKELKTDFANLNQEISKILTIIEDHDQGKASKQEMQEIVKSFTTKLDLKAESSEVDYIPKLIQANLDKIKGEARDSLQNKVSKLESQLISELDRKVSITDLHTYLSEKADTTQLNRLINSRTPIEDTEFLRQDLEKLTKEVFQRTTKQEFQQHVLSTKYALEEVGKDMLLKANLQDMVRLLDGKASIDEVNSALTQIHHEMDRRPGLDEYNTHLSQQSLILDALCSENTVGRWIWKSGDTRAGYQVPWEVQSINTAPDNFIWERDTTGIVVISPGLYEISFGFYSNKKPNVKLLVNGEPILSAVNNASYVIHHSSGRLKSVPGHSAGNITGLTLIDFIALPQRARISLNYTGDNTAEGFLSLRRL